MAKEGDVMFMVDIESTGVDIRRDEVLEIGLLKLAYTEGLWQPGAAKRLVLHTDREPRSQFAREHMAALYAECKEAPELDQYQVKEILNDFLIFHSPEDRARMCGWNASNFDLAMLVEKGFLKAPGYETIDGVDYPTGDFDYRVYELGGLLAGCVDAYGIEDRSSFIREVKEIGEKITSLPFDLRTHYDNAKAHDAIYDCVEQTFVLNGLIFYMRDRS